MKKPPKPSRVKRNNSKNPTPVVLKRLIDEVAAERASDKAFPPSNPGGYNRTYHRHNR